MNSCRVDLFNLSLEYAPIDRHDVCECVQGEKCGKEKENFFHVCAFNRMCMYSMEWVTRIYLGFFLYQNSTDPLG